MCLGGANWSDGSLFHRQAGLVQLSTLGPDRFNVRETDWIYLRKYVNPINHELYVGFQFLKQFWNPYTISKPSYFITFLTRAVVHTRAGPVQCAGDRLHIDCQISRLADSQGSQVRHITGLGQDGQSGSSSSYHRTPWRHVFGQDGQSGSSSSYHMTPWRHVVITKEARLKCGTIWSIEGVKNVNTLFLTKFKL